MPLPPPTADELEAGNLRCLRGMYVSGLITFEELEQGLHSVLIEGGAINVPRAVGYPSLPPLPPSPFASQP